MKNDNTTSYQLLHNGAGGNILILDMVTHHLKNTTKRLDRFYYKSCSNMVGYVWFLKILRKNVRKRK